MVTIWDVKKSDILGINETPTILVELRGLSSDTKPDVIKNATISNGSSFLEIDTGDIYYMDSDSSDWINPNSSTEEIESTNNEK